MFPPCPPCSRQSCTAFCPDPSLPSVPCSHFIIAEYYWGVHLVMEDFCIKWCAGCYKPKREALCRVLRLSYCISIWELPLSSGRVADSWCLSLLSWASELLYVNNVVQQQCCWTNSHCLLALFSLYHCHCGISLTVFSLKTAANVEGGKNMVYCCTVHSDWLTCQEQSLSLVKSQQHSFWFVSSLRPRKKTLLARCS